MRCRRSGYSFIEMLIVVMIIGILGAVTAPRFFTSMDRFRADAASRRMKADLDLARRQAKLTSTPQAVQFWSTPPKYLLTGIADLDHPGSDYTVDFSTNGYPVVFDSIDFEGNSDLTFNTFGQPQTGSPLEPLNNDGSVVIRSGLQVRTIIINSATGTVTIE